MNTLSISLKHRAIKYIQMMHKHMRSFILVIVWFTIFCCKKEDQLEMPKIQTITVDVQNDSIYLKGNISNLVEKQIFSVGFILNSNNSPDINDQIVFSGKHDENGDFDITIVDNFLKDSVYFVRAIFLHEETIYYRNFLSFISQNLKIPRIYDFSPKLGTDDDYVKIYGINFTNNITDVTVFFGSKQSKVVSCSSDRILVQVPPYTNTDSCLITVNIKSNQAISSKPFFLSGPIINDFTPTEGQGEITITINGNNFSDISWRNTVLLGSIKLEVVESSEKLLLVKTDLISIPPGSYPISVITNNKTTVSETGMIVLSPWKQLGSLPIAGLSEAVIFRINNKIYLCTGTTDGLNMGSYTNLFLEYDILTNKWTRKADFPGIRRSRAVSFSIRDKGYIGFGKSYKNEFLSDFWEYNSSSDSWTRKADFPTGARSVAGFSYNNKGFILARNIQNVALTNFWSYDAESDQWQNLPDFTSGGLYNISILIKNDKLYILGGTDVHGNLKNEMWQFDFITNQWKFNSTYSFNPAYTFYDNNNCYIIHIKTDLNAKNELYEFLPESNTLILKPIFPGVQRINGAGILFNGKIYYGTGATGGFFVCLNDFWSFDLE